MELQHRHTFVIRFLKYSIHLTGVLFSVVIAVQDLRDIDQYEEVEDSEEAPNEVPMDQD